MTEPPKKRIKRIQFAVAILSLLEKGPQNKPHVIQPYKAGYNKALKDIAMLIGNEIFEEPRFIAWSGFKDTENREK